MYTYASGGGGGGTSGGGGLLLYIVDEKAANTPGGTSTAGSWQTRTLNTEKVDQIGSTLAANRFTLPAGTYDIFARAPGHGTTRMQARLQNITDAETTIVGSSGLSTTQSNDDSIIMGQFVLAAQKTFEIQFRSESTQATDGMGVESNFGEVETYTQVWIRKVA